MRRASPLFLVLLLASSLASVAQSPSPARIRVALERVQPEATVVSFGLPLARGALADPERIRVTVPGREGALADVRTRTLLVHRDTAGKPSGIRSLLVQFPAAALPGPAAEVEVELGTAAKGASASGTRPFAEVSFRSPESVPVAVRAIVDTRVTYRLEERETGEKVSYTGTEPGFVATFPPGYLARTGLLGEQVSREEALADADRAGLRYLSDNLALFTTSMMYAERYRVNPDAVLDERNYEAWLYDRCATYLVAHAHLGDRRHLRHALRACSNYASRIGTSGPFDGIFTGKSSPDKKYSHLRGVFAYYALTGDDTAFQAASRMAAMWSADLETVGPYRQGRLRGPDRLWTERLLAAGLEGLVYGYALTGNAEYRKRATELFETAYRHVTLADAAQLQALTRTAERFPPQDCFIHSAAQHAEGKDDQPWCSTWMTELAVDPLLAYQEMTGDARVDEVFVRLGRFLRDIGATYFLRGPVPGTTFLDPKNACHDGDTGRFARTLVPPYGTGRDATGWLRLAVEDTDREHCVDATGLVAASMRALVRQGKWEAPVRAGPFTTEGQSFLALFHEFSACAERNFRDHHRPQRDPATWQSNQLAPGYQDGDAARQRQWLERNRVGFPSHQANPQRKLSWWFNTAMSSFAWLRSAGIPVERLETGYVQGQGCPAPARPVPAAALRKP